MTYKNINVNDIFNCLPVYWKMYVGIAFDRGSILVYSPLKKICIVISTKGEAYCDKEHEEITRAMIENLAENRGIELATIVTEEEFNSAFLRKIGKKQKKGYLEQEIERYKESDTERRIDGEEWKGDNWNPNSLLPS